MIDQAKSDKLVAKGIEAYKNAYARYSGYSVGAALLSKSGKIFTGVNVENAVYPLTICAERTAVFKAVSEGELDFEAIAVITKDGGTPCGSCRQVLAEFGTDIAVIIADITGKVYEVINVAELLPKSFGSENLKTSG